MAHRAGKAARNLAAEFLRAVRCAPDPRTHAGHGRGYWHPVLENITRAHQRSRTLSGSGTLHLLDESRFSKSPDRNHTPGSVPGRRWTPLRYHLGLARGNLLQGLSQLNEPRISFRLRRSRRLASVLVSGSGEPSGGTQPLRSLRSSAASNLADGCTEAKRPEREKTGSMEVQNRILAVRVSSPVAGGPTRGVAPLPSALAGVSVLVCNRSSGGRFGGHLYFRIPTDRPRHLEFLERIFQLCPLPRSRVLRRAFFL